MPWEIFLLTWQVDKENRWFGLLPRISFTDKETYVESETKQYDMVRLICFYNHVSNFVKSLCTILSCIESSRVDLLVSTNVLILLAAETGYHTWLLEKDFKQAKPISHSWQG